MPSPCLTPTTSKQPVDVCRLYHSHVTRGVLSVEAKVGTEAPSSELEWCKTDSQLQASTPSNKAGNGGLEMTLEVCSIII